MEPGTQHYLWVGADLQTLVDGPAYGMLKPAGLVPANARYSHDENLKAVGVTK